MSAHSCLNALYQLAATFAFRHWMIGLDNGVVTAAFGIGILTVIQWVGLLKPVAALSVKRFVYIVALYKAAFYLVFGESVTFPRTHRWALGFQFPSLDSLGFPTATNYSIWHAAPLTYALTLSLTVYALYKLVRRVRLLSAASRFVNERTVFPTPKLGEAIRSSVKKAAVDLGKPRLASVQVAVVSSLPGASPFVLGLFGPRIIIAEETLNQLLDTPGCLDAAIRHEIMHIVRQDHIARWLLAWLEDVGSVTLVSRLLGTRATGLEEQLCDSAAIITAADASLLTRAIMIASGHASRNSKANQTAGKSEQLESVLPSHAGLGLLGIADCSDYERRALLGRLRFIAFRAKALSMPAIKQIAGVSGPVHASLDYWRKWWLANVVVYILQITTTCCLAVLLLAVLYTKFFFFWLSTP